jgi:hypothetical protein
MSISIPKTIPDAKLHRLELTPFEIRLLINALDFAIGNTSARPNTGNHFALRALLKRSQVSQPEPFAPTDEEIEQWADAATEVPLEEMDPEVHGWRRCFTAKEFSETIRAALARWGTPAIQPVPVSERLPGPEDCDAKGRCWVGYAVPKDDLETEYNPSWELCKFHPPDEVWLPHWALPVPAGEGAS